MRHILSGALTHPADATHMSYGCCASDAIKLIGRNPVKCIQIKAPCASCSCRATSSDVPMCRAVCCLRTCVPALRMWCTRIRVLRACTHTHKKSTSHARVAVCLVRGLSIWRGFVNSVRMSAPWRGASHSRMHHHHMPPPERERTPHGAHSTYK